MLYFMLFIDALVDGLSVSLKRAMYEMEQRHADKMKRRHIGFILTHQFINHQPLVLKAMDETFHISMSLTEA